MAEEKITKVVNGITYVWEYVGRDCDTCPCVFECSNSGTCWPGYNASPDCGYEWVPIEEKGA